MNTSTKDPASVAIRVRDSIIQTTSKKAHMNEILGDNFQFTHTAMQQRLKPEIQELIKKEHYTGSKLCTCHQDVELKMQVKRTNQCDVVREGGQSCDERIGGSGRRAFLLTRDEGGEESRIRPHCKDCKLGP